MPTGDYFKFLFNMTPEQRYVLDELADRFEMSRGEVLRSYLERDSKGRWLEKMINGKQRKSVQGH